MYKILIVDDEQGIREGLRHLLEWEEFNTEIVGAAANGKEALVLIAQHKPDILITDVRMPVMDGLELIKEIHKNAFPPRVIMLSGYDESAYVREAMKYGAENYLLKPVDREELSNSIKELVKSLDNKRITLISEREGIRILRDNTLSRIVRNDISIKEFGEKAEFLGIDLNFRYLQVAAVELDLSFVSKDPGPELGWMKFAVLNICEEVVQSRSDAIVFMDPSDIVIILFKNDSPLMEMKAEVEDLLFRCMEQISSIIKVPCFSAVGGEVNSHRDLGISYRQAIVCLDYKLALGMNKTAFYSDTIGNRTSNGIREALNLNAMNEWIRKRNKDEFVSYVDKTFLDLHEAGKLSPGQIRDLLIEIVISVLNVARDYRQTEPYVVDMNEFMRKLQTAKQLRELLEEVHRIACEAMDYIDSIMDKKYSKTVGEAIEYVNNRFDSQEISLKTLAAFLNVNSAYLGRTFKEETGEFFSDYLVKLRIEKAKHYLTTSHLKINDISTKVGFMNSNYFYTVFKKHTGLNPGNYRQV